MSTCSRRPNVSAMLVRYAPIRGIPFPFKDLLPWEEAPLSRSCSRGKRYRLRACSHGRRSRPGPAPVGGGSPSRSCSRGRRLPFPGPAPIGGGSPFKVLLPWEEVPFKGLLPREELTSRSCSRRRKFPFCSHGKRSHSSSQHLRRKTTGTLANYFSIYRIRLCTGVSVRVMITGQIFRGFLAIFYIYNTYTVQCTLSFNCGSLSSPPCLTDITDIILNYVYYVCVYLLYRPFYFWWSSGKNSDLYTVLSFVSTSAKFGICTVVGFFKVLWIRYDVFCIQCWNRVGIGTGPPGFFRLFFLYFTS
jgi:hypothetical protein